MRQVGSLKGGKHILRIFVKRRGILNSCRDPSRLPDLSESAINVLSFPYYVIGAERTFTTMIDRYIHKTQKSVDKVFSQSNEK